MIEVAFTYDFIPNFDVAAYTKVARTATQIMVSSKGFIEFRANRNLMGSPNVRRTSVWQSFADYAAMSQSPEFQKITEDFRKFVTHIDVQIWGPSPISPEPIRP
jgi:heme-degrading monooxygenase HmoA